MSCPITTHFAFEYCCSHVVLTIFSGLPRWSVGQWSETREQNWDRRRVYVIQNPNPRRLPDSLQVKQNVLIDNWYRKCIVDMFCIALVSKFLWAYLYDKCHLFFFPAPFPDFTLGGTLQPGHGLSKLCVTFSSAEVGTTTFLATWHTWPGEWHSTSRYPLQNNSV